MALGDKTDMRRFGPDQADCWRAQGVSVTNAVVALLAAQGAGIKAVIDDIAVMNPTTTDTVILLLDGSTEVARFVAPAGGGVVRRPRFIGTANTAWNFNSTVSLAGVYVSVSGYYVQ